MAKRVGERDIFKTKFFTVKDIDIEFGDKKVTYQIIDNQNSALIVPINERGELILVREFFYAINEYQLGLPKGRIEKGLDELETAHKELQEEIGFKAGSMEKLGIVTVSPGYSTQKTFLFLATDLTESKLIGDEEEDLEVLTHPFDKFEQLIDQGKITDARMIATLYLAKRFLQKLS